MQHGHANVKLTLGCLWGNAVRANEDKAVSLTVHCTREIEKNQRF